MCVRYCKYLVLIIVQKPSELFLKFYLVVSRCLLQQCHKSSENMKPGLVIGDDNKSALDWALQITQCFSIRFNWSPQQFSSSDVGNNISIICWGS